MKRISLKRYYEQLVALIEKNILLEMRIKYKFVFRFLNPIIQILLLIIIFRKFFSYNSGYKIGYWTAENFSLFLLLAFCVQFSKSITKRYSEMFMSEKYWKTLNGIMVAPMNKYTLLGGTLISEFVLNSIPICVLFIIALILYPINIYFIFLTIVVFFSIILIFGGIGLLIGAFSISNEELAPYANLILLIVFFLSCSNYPKEIFPIIIQQIIMFNPLYYVFDLLRLTWYLGIDYHTAIRLISPTHIIIIITMTLLTPITSIYIFNRMFKKHGIVAY